MKKVNGGIPQKMTVKNKRGEIVDVFDSIEKCRQKYYPHRNAGYISAVLYNRHKDYFYDDVLGLSFFRGGEGKYDAQKTYKVINRKTGKQKTYNNATKMIRELGGMTTTSFYKHIRHFGNFKNNDYIIFPI